MSAATTTSPGTAGPTAWERVRGWSPPSQLMYMEIS